MSRRDLRNEGEPHSAPPPGAGRRHVGVLLRTAFNGFVDDLFSRLAEEGFDDLRPAHSPVFQYLEPGGVRLSALAERARITNQSMGYLVDYLEAHGYVERVPDPTDGRAALIRATARGEAQVRAARRLIAAIERDWERRIGAERWAALVDGLGALDTELRAG